MKMRSKPHFKSGLEDWVKKVREIKIRELPNDRIYLKGIEIGSYNGESAEILIKHTDQLICIDPYTPYKDIAARDIYLAKERMLNFMKTTDKVSLLLMSSVEAYDLLCHDEFDYVYIDGNHNYEYVKTDIDCWIDSCYTIGGHDYTDPAFPGVKKAVDEIAELNNKNIITFDDTSWMYINK